MGDECDSFSAAYLQSFGDALGCHSRRGFRPNGFAKPDFMGWEVKQYGVKDFIRFAATSVITLMTPEPTGGVYQQDGVEKFMRSFGYPDKMGRPNRINFGGRYDTTRDFHSNTGLKLVIHGFDAERRKLENLNGYIALIDRSDKVADSWSVKGIIDHWKRKHGRAVYVPSIHQSDPTAYAFGQIVDMCEGGRYLEFSQCYRVWRRLPRPCR